MCRVRIWCFKRFRYRWDSEEGRGRRVEWVGEYLGRRVRKVVNFLVGVGVLVI